MVTLASFVTLLGILSRVLAVPVLDQEPFISSNSPTYTPRTVQVQRFNVTSRGEGHRLMYLAKSLNADIWSTTPDYIDMMLPSPYVPAELSGFEHTVISHLIPALPQVNIGQPNVWSLEDLNTPFHEGYHRFQEIIEFANELARTFPHYVELVRLGQSSEDRELLALRIEKPGGKKIKPRIVLQGAQHGRDWIATSSALYIAHALVVSKEQRLSMIQLLDDFAFTIIPIPNPDGYEYTFNEDRLWYKNRTPVDADNQCVGIDMNRNWGEQWEYSPDPCHHWYGGSHAFEAPEVNAIATYIERTPNIKALIDLRSYGQMLMYPFSYTCDRVPADAEDLIEAALGAVKASKNVHGTNMLTGSACELLYSAPGNMIDWAYSSAGINFAYSISLRDTGTYGFLLPPWLIRPVGEETAVLVEYLSNWILKRKL